MFDSSETLLSYEIQLNGIISQLKNNSTDIFIAKLNSEELLNDVKTFKETTFIGSCSEVYEFNSLIKRIENLINRINKEIEIQTKEEYFISKQNYEHI